MCLVLSTKEDVLAGGINLSDPKYGVVTLVGKQEEAIREYAERQQFKRGLTGFHMHLRSEEWSYYDAIKEAYK